ncbi:MAG TPA: DASS family sodium-coupled anion symporter [Oligoflexia bacterium]|nr:DASS family sodium-coupled anion symporter [Oligoflexia bacterium]HMP48934.1 DASS family sodium-coupled anion symporter [Oligoflexia bacterium]
MFISAKTLKLSQRFFILLGFLLAISTLFISLPREVLALLVLLIALSLWISEALPVAVTALFVPVLAIFTGILSPEDAFSAFGSPVVLLLVSVLILTRLVVSSGLAERITVHLLSGPLMGSSLRSLCIGLSLVCWLVAWWISNTAAAALFLPLVLALIPKLENLLSSPEYMKNVRYRLLLTCGFIPSLGGMVTPVGSLPNLVSIEALRQEGINISFGTWMSFGGPISFVFVIIFLSLLEVLYPLPRVSLKGIKPELRKEKSKLKPISFDEKCVLFSFLVTVFLWLLPSIQQNLELGFLESLARRLTVHVSAIFGVFLLFSLKILGTDSKIDWKAASGFDWGIILLFAGGLCLGKTVIEGGLPVYILNLTGISEGEVSGSSLASLVIPFTILLSEFCSNTVAASILVPSVLKLNPADVVLPVITALSAGFGFMLPISTPPNALVYGTGKLPLIKMIITGLIFDILGGFVLFIYFVILSN